MAFRARHEIIRRAGMMKRGFPTEPPFRTFISLAEWKQRPAKFFFEDRHAVRVPINPTAALGQRMQYLKDGKLLLFNSTLTDLGRDYDWVTNPASGFRYDAHKHWTEIADYSKDAGDIKLVWEKSRFSYLYDIIRYDHHFEEDNAAMVFGDIMSWIRSNPVNCGPNYRCSQEMSLRVLNWTFALYFYKHSPALTGEVFGQMMHVIYWHLQHVYANIDFSRIAVRNNHAITETLTLHLAGMLFPFFPEAELWKRKGGQWFAEEVAYQVYEDGTFLQFSMNYHRIVAQLLTWAVVLIPKNSKEGVDSMVLDRAQKTLEFLRTCMVEENGWLPNYGANDGALFFRLSDTHYRDYRPQLQGLAAALGRRVAAGADEDMQWYGLGDTQLAEWRPAMGPHSFATGGYYVLREADTLTFIRCGRHKDRPSQADNLHLDVWYKGDNILTDAGSYKYNTDDATMRYFNGTAAHNTVMLGDNDQMLKGGRFIWYHWSQATKAGWRDQGDSYVFSGSVQAFGYIGKGIVHNRVVRKQKNAPQWEITDEVENKPARLPMRQLWHVPATTPDVMIAAAGRNGSIVPEQEGCYASSLYGQKERTTAYIYTHNDNFIVATIAVVPE